MSEPEAVDTIVRRIMREMAETIAKVAGDPKDWEDVLKQLEEEKQYIRNIELKHGPVVFAPPTLLPKPRLRLLKGGKEAPCGDSSPD